MQYPDNYFTAPSNYLCNDTLAVRLSETANTVNVKLRKYVRMLLSPSMPFNTPETRETDFYQMVE